MCESDGGTSSTERFPLASPPIWSSNSISHSIYFLITLNGFLICIYLLIAYLLRLECKFHLEQGLCPSWLTLSVLGPAQCLAQSRCSVNPCEMEWMGEELVVSEKLEKESVPRRMRSTGSEHFWGVWRGRIRGLMDVAIRAVVSFPRAVWWSGQTATGLLWGSRP